MAAIVAAAAAVVERVDAGSGGGGCRAVASASHTSWVVKPY